MWICRTKRTRGGLITTVPYRHAHSCTFDKYQMFTTKCLPQIISFMLNVLQIMYLLFVTRNIITLLFCMTIFYTLYRRCDVHDS